MKEISGSCLCGNIQYKASGPFRATIACHCIECRKFTGHFSAASSVSPENLSLDGESLKWYRSSATAQRGFCQNCGSSLFYKTDLGDRISFFSGTIDCDADLPLTAHIYVGEKGSYYQIPDDAETFIGDGAKLTLDRES